MDRRIDPLRDIDWEDDFVWVQRSPVLNVLERTADWVHVRHPRGGEIILTRIEAETCYLAVRDGAMLKPRYAPVKAHAAGSAACVELPCGTVRLEAGDVLLNDSGRFKVVRSAIFDRDFVAVAYPGTREKPALPFPDHA